MEIEVTGIDTISAKVNSLSDDIRKKLRTTIDDVIQLLETRVVDNKLNGGALNRRSGRLYRSVKSEVNDTSTSITGRVYTSGVPYARIHEYGGTIRTRLGTGTKPPRKAGKATINMPMRSYMRSSLQELRGQIIEQISGAVGEVIE